MKASRSTVNWYQTMYRGAVFSFSENQIGRTIMKKIRALLLVLLAAMLCALLAGCGEKDVSVSVTLVNRSGRDISSISITPSTSSDWDTEFVDGMFHDGESIESGLGTYKESEVPDTYNILVYNDENTILYDTSVDELDFAIQDGDYIVFLPPEGEVPIEITHDYDPSAYELDYEPTTPAAGSWKTSRFILSSTRSLNGLPSISTANRSAPAMWSMRASASRFTWRTTLRLSLSGRRPTGT